MDEIEYLKKLEKQIGTNYIAQSEGYEPQDKSFGLTDAEFLTIRMMVSNYCCPIKLSLAHIRA